MAGEKVRINFHSVFEADRASQLLDWERHHSLGSLEFDVSEKQLKILRKKNIGFWLE